MNRAKLIEAILAKYREHGAATQESILMDALKRITSDANLIMFAADIGVDTDAVFAPKV